MQLLAKKRNALEPKPTIWFVIDFQYRGNILKIHSVKKEDRGTYYCVADNGVGKSARCQYYFIILYAIYEYLN